MKVRGRNYLLTSIIMYNTVVPSCWCIQRSCQVDVHAFHLLNVYAAMCIPELDGKLDFVSAFVPCTSR